MSHNQMSEYAFGLLAEGLASNSKLTDLFFTHNDLQLGGDGGKRVIQSL